MDTATARRPLKTRQAAWANALARVLVKARISPNAISMTSVVFALAGATALYFSGQSNSSKRSMMLLLAVAGIQGRLLCNMLDGMVAIEGGRHTKSGEIFNDLPDRVADGLIFAGAGYAARAHPFGVELGFITAALAIFTAYVRVLGGASGLKQSFIGPMAKQHRMATLTFACVLSIVEGRLFGVAEPTFWRPGAILWIALIIISLGCIVAIWRRTTRIAQELEAR